MTIARFGLIGYGAWGSRHARAITSVPGAQLVAVAAHSQASCARATAEHPGARVYSDPCDMLAGEELDAVAVVLPSHLHHQAAKDVLLSGRHLLLETPMCLDLAHCDELIALARERGLALAVGHELRVSPLWGRVKELIGAGAVGEPLYALLELWRRPHQPGSDGWRNDPRRVGDWVLEEPIHCFDLARWYFAALGEPVSVVAAASGARPDQPELHDNFSAIVHFPRGRYAVVAQTLAAWNHHQTVKLTGTAGAIWATGSGATDGTIEPTFSLKLMRADRVEDVPIAKPSGEGYNLVEHIRRVTEAVTRGTPLPCTGDDGRWSVAMCLKARESLSQGRPVPLAGG
jgi:myo-inositol 2-dehydrogenase/D-chiro-inositol 1-dehydrogenase